MRIKLTYNTSFYDLQVRDDYSTSKISALVLIWQYLHLVTFAKLCLAQYSLQNYLSNPQQSSQLAQ